MSDYFDQEKLNEEIDEANSKKKMLGLIGGVGQAFINNPTSHELLYGGKLNRYDLSGQMDKAAKNIEDPTERQMKTFQMAKAAKENEELRKKSEEDAILRDPNSQRSKAYKAFAVKRGMQVDDSTSAYDVLQMMDPKRVNEIEAQSKIDSQKRQEDYANQLKLLGIKHGQEKELKTIQDNNELGTQFGLARTKDDAKKIKEAADIKDAFDRKLSEMIALREKHNGGTAFNREDVARGKQLSNELMLAYKDLANLGVMSKSDEGILRSVIPADPLEYNVSGLLNQDPTMHKLKKFQADSQSDFDSRLKTRLQSDSYAKMPKKDKKKYVVDGGSSNPLFSEANASGPVPVRRVRDPQTKKTVTIYSDGSEVEE
jgi:hypothetical protein